MTGNILVTLLLPPCNFTLVSWIDFPRESVSPWRSATHSANVQSEVQTGDFGNHREWLKTEPQAQGTHPIKAGAFTESARKVLALTLWLNTCWKQKERKDTSNHQGWEGPFLVALNFAPCLSAPQLNFLGAHWTQIVFSTWTPHHESLFFIPLLRSKRTKPTSLSMFI